MPQNNDVAAKMKAVSCLLSFRCDCSSGSDATDAMLLKVKGVLKEKLDLVALACVPLNDGCLTVFSTPGTSDNANLTASLKTYSSQSLVTLDLEGAAAGAVTARQWHSLLSPELLHSRQHLLC